MIASWYRIWTIVSMAVRFYLQLLLMDRKLSAGTADAAKQWSALAGRQAAEFRETALHLQGLMIKVGQFLSTRADVMPESFTRELKSLTDRVPPMAYEDAVRVLETEWGSGFDARLKQIDRLPVAAASIADVYRGVLHDGTEVAVKIQRAGIEKKIQADFRAIRIVIRLIKWFTDWGKWTDFDRLNIEFTAIITQELDFLQERRHALRFEQEMKGVDHARVPFYYEAYCTRRVLVMEWIEGKRVNDPSAIRAAGLTPQQVNERLTRSFLHQILISGFFHADPHPGNLLLKPDGTIVWIDFGMMGMIPPDDRKEIRNCIVALVFRRFHDVADALEKLHFFAPSAEKDKLADVIRVTFDLYAGKQFLNVDLQTMDTLLGDLRDFVRKQPVQLPAEYAFLGRSFSLMSGVLTEIDPEIDFFALGKPIVQPWLMPDDAPVKNVSASRDGSNDDPAGLTADTLFGFPLAGWFREAAVWLEPLLRPLQAVAELPEAFLVQIRNQTAQSIRREKQEQRQMQWQLMNQRFERLAALTLMVWLLTAAGWFAAGWQAVWIGAPPFGLFALMTWQSHRKLQKIWYEPEGKQNES